MKKSFTFCLLFLSFTTLFAQSTIRVQAGQDLQTAIDATAAGSTILVDGGTFGAVTLSKRITLIGAGAFVANPSTITSIAFNFGSDNSALIGFKVLNNEGVFINHNVSNILIKSNHIQRIYTPSVACTSNCGTINNLSIIHNVISDINFDILYSELSNFIIRNNIISSFSAYGSPYANLPFLPITGNVNNNTISGGLSCLFYYNNNLINFKNNIMSYLGYGSGYYCFEYTPQTFNYNLTYHALFNSSNTLLNYSDRYIIFIGFPNNIVGESLPFQFQLAPNSPARGIGENGVDCGAFGGPDPFPLSGAGGHPHIYELSAPSSVSSGQTLNATVKAKVTN